MVLRSSELVALEMANVMITSSGGRYKKMKVVHAGRQIVLDGSMSANMNWLR